ncbi:MAG: S8 family serine peptidase [Fibrobacterota bacterium]|nr:MAG: S8 family serine peptidase [Fibrobacterota bacterium]
MSFARIKWTCTTLFLSLAVTAWAKSEKKVGRILPHGISSREVLSWKATGPRGSGNEFWLFTNSQSGGVPIEEMAKAAGFSADGASKTDEGFIYKVTLSKPLSEVFDSLKRFPAFYNLEPVSKADEVDPNIAYKWKRKQNPSFAQNVEDMVQVRVRRDLAHGGQLLGAFCENAGLDSCELLDSGSTVQGKLNIQNLQRLLQDPTVKRVEEVSKPGLPQMDVARSLIGVNQLQSNLDLSTYGAPGAQSLTDQWNLGKENTGEGIVIGISDNPIDSTHPDFREGGKLRAYTDSRDSAATTRPGWCDGSRAGPSIPNECFSYQDDYMEAMHGTFVAGVAAGNGQNSEARGGQRFQWRGVAPKAMIASFRREYLPMLGDVNNHSHLTSLTYTVNSQNVDRYIANHSGLEITGNEGNVYVVAAGNSGWVSQKGRKEIGYFTSHAFAKNAITVAASIKDVKARASFSSMGPMADGRIGIDVLAPGKGKKPQMSCPLRAEFDYFRITNSGGIKTVGAEAMNWDFLKSNDGWFQSTPISGGTWRNVDTTVDGYLRGEGTGVPTWRKMFLKEGKVSTDDVLEYRVRLTPLDVCIQNGAVIYSTLINFFGTVQSPNPKNGIVSELHVGDWIDVRVPIGKKVLSWENWIGIGIKLEEGDQIVTANGGAYLPTWGSSIAAPVVSGVVALMLQQHKINNEFWWAKEGKGQNIHNSPFWSSTARGVLIHTAEDIADTAPGAYEVPNPDFVANDSIYSKNLPREKLLPVSTVGPDWATGYGLINAKKAVEYIKETKFLQRTLPQGKSDTFEILMPSGQSTYRATIAWDDPPMANPEPQPDTTDGHFYRNPLVNDLDLTMVSPTGKVFYPWVLDFDKIKSPTGFKTKGIENHLSQALILANPAKRTGPDRLNNVEVVDLDNPVPGKWKVIVKAHTINSALSKQDYSLIGEGINTSGLEVKDASGKVLSIGLDGNLQSKGCTWGQVVAPKMAWQNASSQGVSFSRNAGVSVAIPNANQKSWLQTPSNTSAGMVVRNSRGEVVSLMSSSGALTVGGTATCNTGM